MSRDSYTCEAAADSGHLDILKWAVISGCAMEREENDDQGDHYFNVCEAAAEKGYWDVVKLSWDRGCSCSDSIKVKFLQDQLELQRSKYEQQIADMQIVHQNELLALRQAYSLP